MRLLCTTFPDAASWQRRNGTNLVDFVYFAFACRTGDIFIFIYSLTLQSFISSRLYFSHKKFGSLYPGKASCDRVALKINPSSACCFFLFSLMCFFTIHRPLTWITRSLTCIYVIFLHAYTHGVTSVYGLIRKT